MLRVYAKLKEQRQDVSSSFLDELDQHEAAGTLETRVASLLSAE